MWSGVKFQEFLWALSSGLGTTLRIIGRSSKKGSANNYYRGLNNYQYYFWGFLLILIVECAPKPCSNG